MGANRDGVTADAVAQRMSSHIDGLARALAAAGAPAEATARLLELAALATMHAATLVEIAAEPPEHALPAVPEPAAPFQAQLLSAAA